MMMIGFTAHSLTDMLPTMWGINVVMDNPSPSTAGGMIAFIMALAFLLPLLAILSLMYCKGRWDKLTQRIFAPLYLLFNTLHASELVMDFELAQLFIMPFLILISLLLTIEAYRKIPHTDR